MGSRYNLLIAICLYLLINKVESIDCFGQACKSMHANELWAPVASGGEGGDTLPLH